MLPFRKRNKKEIIESEQAMLDANKTLRQVKARDDEVHEVSTSLRKIRERNHFAENLRFIMEGR